MVRTIEFFGVLRVQSFIGESRKSGYCRRQPRGISSRRNGIAGRWRSSAACCRNRGGPDADLKKLLAEGVIVSEVNFQAATCPLPNV